VPMGHCLSRLHCGPELAQSPPPFHPFPPSLSPCRGVTDPAERNYLRRSFSPPASNPASYPIQSLRLSSRFMYRHFFALLQGSVSVSAPPPSFLPHTSHSVRAPSVSLTGSYPDGSGSPPFSVVGYAPLPAPLLSLYLLSFRSFSFQRPPALLSSHRPSATTRAIRSEAPQWQTSLSTALSSPAAPQSTALSNQPVIT
jgi:hypothetical protein